MFQNGCPCLVVFLHRQCFQSLRQADKVAWQAANPPACNIPQQDMVRFAAQVYKTVQENIPVTGALLWETPRATENSS